MIQLIWQSNYNSSVSFARVLGAITITFSDGSVATAQLDEQNVLVEESLINARFFDASIEPVKGYTTSVLTLDEAQAKTLFEAIPAFFHVSSFCHIRIVLESLPNAVAHSCVIYRASASENGFVFLSIQLMPALRTFEPQLREKSHTLAAVDTKTAWSESLKFHQEHFTVRQIENYEDVVDALRSYAKRTGSDLRPSETDIDDLAYMLEFSNDVGVKYYIDNDKEQLLPNLMIAGPQVKVHNGNARIARIIKDPALPKNIANTLAVCIAELEKTYA